MTGRVARVAWIAVVVGLLSLPFTGCDDPVQVGGPVAPGGGAAGARSAKNRRAAPEEPAPAPENAPPAASPDAGVDAAVVLSYLDEDFVEVDTENRDPFRSYAAAFKARPPAAIQRRVLMSTVAVDDMRLIAVISGVAQPRAMLVVPGGVGYVVSRGDYIGRPEVLQSGGAEGMPVTLNWRVDRIRPEEIVLTREDPTAPDRPPLTRRVLLSEEVERPNESIVVH